MKFDPEWDWKQCVAALNVEVEVLLRSAEVRERALGATLEQTQRAIDKVSELAANGDTWVLMVRIAEAVDRLTARSVEAEDLLSEADERIAKLRSLLNESEAHIKAHGGPVRRLLRRLGL